MEQTSLQAKQAGPGWAWPLWGVAAGVLGAIGHIFAFPDVSEEEYQSGAALIETLDRTTYHIGVVAGLLAVFSLLLFASGFRRWAAAIAPASLAAGAVTMALVASAGAMILGYGMKGSLAVYLPGGIDEGSMASEGLYSVFMFLDLGPFMAWWGVAMAAAAIGWLSLRERVLPLWLGVLSALFVVIPLGVLVATGLPGFPGVVDPLWLVITGVGLAVTLRRSVPARVVQPAYSS
jgi:hypothetical protein